MGKPQQLFDIFARDRQGRVVIFQSPNAPLITGVIALLCTKLLPYGQLNFIAELISYGALFTWGWLELMTGLSLIRRIVGGGFLALLILSRIM